MDETPGRDVPLDEREEPMDAALSSVVRELGAEARARRDPHPDPEALIDYHLGALDAAAAERIRAHTETCPDCARAVLDLGELARFEAAPGDPSAEEVAVRWRGLEKELAKRAAPAASETAAEVVPFADRARPAPPRWRMPATWAAALLVAVLLLLFFRREAAVPQPNVHVASLVPAAEALARSNAEPLDTLRVPAAAERFVLILNLTDSRSFPRYRLQVTRAPRNGEAAAEVWRSEDLRRAATGNFTVEFDRRFLTPGRFLLELSGLGDGEPVSLARYTVELIYE